MGVPRLVFGPRLESLFYPRAVTPQEVFDGPLRVFVIARILQTFQRLEVPPASVFERWDGELWKLALSCKGAILSLWRLWLELGDGARRHGWGIEAGQLDELVRPCSV